MLMTPPTARSALLILCGGFAAVIAAELAFEAAGVGATSGARPPSAATRSGVPISSPDIEATVAQILERPIFSTNRQPAAAPPTEAEEIEEKQPPQLQGRLAGVTILPGESEALFERDGEKPVAVKAGGQIDGWTVTSISLDQVVLSSEFGKQVLKPTPGDSALARVNKMAVARPKNANTSAVIPGVSGKPAQARRPGVANRAQASGSPAAMRR
jgi:hypothetical protein